MSKYPSWLREQENKLVAERQAQVWSPGEAAPVSVRVGLALSGGGIRSATFALGLLQGMARQGALKAIDYVSSVSGGGYAGAFWGGMFVQGAARKAPDGAATAHPTAASVEKRLAQDPGSDCSEVAWLRHNSRYLVPSRGAGVTALAILLRNWLSVLLNLIVPASAVFLLGCGVRLIPWQAPLHALGLGGLSKPHIVASVWWSPLTALPLLCLVASLPLGAAYWLVPDRQPGMRISSTAFALGIASLTLLPPAWMAYAMQKSSSAQRTLLEETAGTWLAVPVGISLVFVSALLVRGYVERRHAESLWHKRHWLTLALKNVLVLFAVSAALALIDSLGQTVYALAGRDPARVGSWLGKVFGPLLTLAALGPRLVAFAGQFKPGRKLAAPLSIILLLAGLLVAGFWLVLAAALAHTFAWHGATPPGDPAGRIFSQLGAANSHKLAQRMDALWWAAGLGLALATTFLQGQLRPFLNQSSLSMFYAARLTRTFLGASNPRRKRLQDTASGNRAADAFDATEPVLGDDICTADYAPHAHGGPLHVINATLNETIDARTAAERREGQELSFALGPCALSVGLQHHARRIPNTDRDKLELLAGREDPAPAQPRDGTSAPPAAPAFTLFAPGSEPADALSIGRWIAISGAAVAPGLGARSSLGAALLTVFFNLRLGHWWFSGTDPYAHNSVRSSKVFARLGRTAAQLLPVLSHLTDEVSLRFHGTARRHWYLSDGGHFENTACYELLRRKLELIICSDAGADPDYAFADIGNLVRRSRLDFGADIEFLDSAQLADVLDPRVLPHFGSLAELRAQASGAARTDKRNPRAALAYITYADRTRGLLILIKPMLTGVEPHDLLDYRSSNESFPQQSTADQFFDEAQWESYRKLGDYTGSLIFQNVEQNKASRFYPGSLAAGPAVFDPVVREAIRATIPSADSLRPVAQSDTRELTGLREDRTGS